MNSQSQQQSSPFPPYEYTALYTSLLYLQKHMHFGNNLQQREHIITKTSQQATKQIKKQKQKLQRLELCLPESLLLPTLRSPSPPHSPLLIFPSPSPPPCLHVTFSYACDHKMLSFICISVLLRLLLCVCMCTFMRACVHACMPACVCVNPIHTN